MGVLSGPARALIAGGVMSAPGIFLAAAMLSIGDADTWVVWLFSVLLVAPHMAVGLVLAAPLLALFRTLGWKPIWGHLTTGVAAGAVVGAFVLGIFPDNDRAQPSAFNWRAAFYGAQFGAGYGLWSALIWHFVFHRPRLKASRRLEMGRR